MTNEQAKAALPVAFEATVTYFRNYEKTLFVQDGDLAIYVQATTTAQLDPGDRVLIKGATHESFRPYVLSSGCHPAASRIAARSDSLHIRSADSRPARLPAGIREGPAYEPPT